MITPVKKYPCPPEDPLRDVWHTVVAALEGLHPLLAEEWAQERKIMASSPPEVRDKEFSAVTSVKTRLLDSYPFYYDRLVPARSSYWSDVKKILTGSKGPGWREEIQAISHQLNTPPHLDEANEVLIL